MKTTVFLKYFVRACRINSSMRGDEGSTFSKAVDWKPLFLLMIKIKQNQNKEYNAIFQHIHQNIRAYSTNKKL